MAEKAENKFDCVKFMREAWARMDAETKGVADEGRARLATFFDYPPAIRKVVYTTNAIESLNYSLRRVIRDKGSFPNDEAVLKLLWLALNEASKKWTRPVKNWKDALNQFVILYGDRMPDET